MRARTWDERDHGLDIPHEIETTDFKVSRTGHERIERVFHDCCAERRTYTAGLSDTPAEQQIAKWMCVHACSFILFATKARATVIVSSDRMTRRRSGASLCLVAVKRNLTKIRGKSETAAA